MTMAKAETLILIKTMKIWLEVWLMDLKKPKGKLMPTLVDVLSKEIYPDCNWVNENQTRFGSHLYSMTHGVTHPVHNAILKNLAGVCAAGMVGPLTLSPWIQSIAFLYPAKSLKMMAQSRFLS